jgi:cyanate permease
MGLAPDGDAAGGAPVPVTSPAARPLPGALLWRNRCFVTLAAGMAAGLFAQIGLVAHLFSLMVPALGAQQAGLAMGLVTVMAMSSRLLIGWLMPVRTDRRMVACVCYALQALGSVAFMLAQGQSVPLLLLGVLLFGSGFGAATSMPPLIAQVEFVKDDVTRVVALIVGISQGAYAFAPAAFGLIREWVPHAGSAALGAAPWLFAAAAMAQRLAICAFLAGRSRS